MENEEKKIPEAPENGYTPRPAWQVWGARIGLVLFLILLFFYYRNIMTGGL